LFSPPSMQTFSTSCFQTPPNLCSSFTVRTKFYTHTKNITILYFRWSMVWTSRVQSPLWATGFSFLHGAKTGSGPSKPPIQWAQWDPPFPGLKWPLTSI
jgi:hypothetical protein